jgi:small basic protein
VRAAAGLVAALMIGALAMHLKVGDPLMKSLPAALMLALSAAIGALR